MSAVCVMMRAILWVLTVVTAFLLHFLTFGFINHTSYKRFHITISWTSQPRSQNIMADEIEDLKASIKVYERELAAAIAIGDGAQIGIFGGLIKTRGDTLNLLLQAPTPAGKLLNYICFLSFACPLLIFFSCIPFL